MVGWGECGRRHIKFYYNWLLAFRRFRIKSERIVTIYKREQEYLRENETKNKRETEEEMGVRWRILLF